MAIELADTFALLCERVALRLRQGRLHPRGWHHKEQILKWIATEALVKIDLSNCRTKEEIEEALRPLGEHLARVRSAFAKAFGEPAALPVPVAPRPPPAKDEP